MVERKDLIIKILHGKIAFYSFMHQLEKKEKTMLNKQRAKEESENNVTEKDEIGDIFKCVRSQRFRSFSGNIQNNFPF